MDGRNENESNITQICVVSLVPSFLYFSHRVVFIRCWCSRICRITIHRIVPFVGCHANTYTRHHTNGGHKEDTCRQSEGGTKVITNRGEGGFVDHTTLSAI